MYSNRSNYNTVGKIKYKFINKMASKEDLLGCFWFVHSFNINLPDFLGIFDWFYNLIPINDEIDSVFDH